MVAVVAFFVGFKAQMFVLPKNLLSCTNVCVTEICPQKEQWPVNKMLWFFFISHFQFVNHYNY